MKLQKYTLLNSFMFGLGICLFLFCNPFVYSQEELIIDECSYCHQLETDSFSLTTHSKSYKCDVCHQGIRQHLDRENKENTIVSPGSLSIKQGNAICFGCHTDIDKDISDKFKATVNLHDDMRCYKCHILHLTEQQLDYDLDSFDTEASVDCAICHVDQADDFFISQHGYSDMQCSDCHKLHQVMTISEDIEEQIERCLFCHPRQELEFKYPYTHPLRERQIKCSDCHNPHSDRYDKMLKKRDDKICAQCHADIVIKGGRHPESQGTDHPFRTVECIDCHKAHGSNFDKLLKHNINRICNTCHN